jgi:hypothetical protein
MNPLTSADPFLDQFDLTQGVGYTPKRLKVKGETSVVKDKKGKG